MIRMHRESSRDGVTNSHDDLDILFQQQPTLKNLIAHKRKKEKSIKEREERLTPGRN